MKINFTHKLKILHPFFYVVALCFLSTKAEEDNTDLRFATQPTHQTAVLGSTVVLPCRVIPRDGTVQWTRDGFGLGTIRRLDGFDRYSMIGSNEEGDFSLKISPVTLEDDSEYQCQVSSKKGPKLRSRVARLTVFVPPESPSISPSPEVSATAGVNVTIKCESIGGRPAPELSLRFL
ncbi:Irregular chiasm C-roughest protein [Armadillidium nasatum]|uniref:Irregular chiasm C-roughest protein n=1 Tax=Armadillidium nasatum TaxID=96803 RepID=A0A5N5SUP1_9CRUS|nr:Irregular chiasm C-roughest protein [Armadillidium nasatum]